MKFGISIFLTEYTIGPAELARAMEDLGFDALFIPEHTHIPVSRRSPYPGGGDLPREYSHTLDPFLALSAAAAVTQRLKLGTGVCLVIEHDPIVLAKEVATLDLLSNGRVLFGIGGGWNYEEMEDHGTRPSLRWRILRERVLAMKQIWMQDEAEYHGRFVNFDPIWQWPKPVQKPHPPVYVGGDGARTLERVVEYGDAWMPIPGRGQTPLPERIAELKAMANQAGRGSIPVTIFNARADARQIEEMAAAGVERMLISTRPSDSQTVLGDLKRYAETMAPYRS